MPIFFECDRCTACCRWPGQVRLTADEIRRVSEFLGVSEFDFVQEYTRLAEDRRGLALKDKVNGECIFLEGNDCRINAVKPQQCRDFPNLWNFPGFQETCRARSVLLNDRDYAVAVLRATGKTWNGAGGSTEPTQEPSAPCPTGLSGKTASVDMP